MFSTWKQYFLDIEIGTCRVESNALYIKRNIIFIISMTYF